MLPHRQLASTRVVRAAARRAFASSASAPPAGAAARRTVPQDGRTLDDFVGGGPAAEAAAPELPKNRRSRKPIERKPRWLKAQPAQGEEYQRLKDTVRSLNLSTVCEEARCPNIGECWGGHGGIATATIMLMGDTCTRACRFCAIKTSNAPPPLDAEEPAKVSKAIHDWGLDYVVLTSVDRDDVADGGADHIARTVELLKDHTPAPLVEVLSPDFSGNLDAVERVVRSGLDVFAHNVETVEPLQRLVRDRRANFKQSMAVLEHALAVRPDVITKTSVMLGCGETDEEVRQLLRDLRAGGVQVVTFGQYLRPTKRHMKVAEYVTPEAFQMWQEEAEAMGFLYVASGPMVRSSYRAGEFYLKNVLKKRQEAAAAAASAAAGSPAQ